MAIKIHSIVQRVLSALGLQKQNDPSDITRPLTEDEKHILLLIQQIYGERNRASNCIRMNQDAIGIWVKDKNGDIPIAVNLTVVANIAREENLSDHDIQEQWLKPHCGSP